MTYEIHKIEWFSDEYLVKMQEYQNNPQRNEKIRYSNGDGTFSELEPFLKPPTQKHTYRTKENKNPIATEKLEGLFSFKWDDDIDKITTSFSFETTDELNCGDWISLYNVDDKVDVLLGIITHTSRSSLYKYTYTGYDMGFYFGENEISIQFNEIQTVSEAIKEVAEKVNVEIGNIYKTNVIVDKLYRKKTAADVLKDLYKIALHNNQDIKNNDTFNKNSNNIISDDYYFNCKNGKLDFIRYNSDLKEIKGKIAEYLEFESLGFIQEFNIESSIEKLKNRVQIYTPNKDDTKRPPLQDAESDPDSIDKYGLLNHIEESSELSPNSRYHIKAKDILKQLNNETITITLNVLSDYKLQKGVIFVLDEEKLNLKADYVVTKSEHLIEGTTERVKITLKKRINNHKENQSTI